MHEIITFVISLTGSALSSAPPPPPRQVASESIIFNHPGLAQDMADHGR